MTDDFGRRLEAATLAARDRCTGAADITYHDLLRIVRAANAQDSATALAPHMFPAPSNEGAGVAGAGVDLADAMRSLRFCIQTPGLNVSAMLKAAQCRALLAHIESLEQERRP